MSTKWSFMEHAGPQVRTQVIARVPSGSPARIRLRTKPSVQPNIPRAALVLAKRHLTMKKAQIALGRLVSDGLVVVEVPVVEDVRTLIQELSDVGIDTALHEPPTKVDVKALREREGMSQEEFALWYGLDVSTIRNWEQGRSQPDQTGRAMLYMIARTPLQIKENLDRPARSQNEWTAEECSA